MILVTGAAGHIGNVLVRELYARGLSVRAFLHPSDDSSHIEDCVAETVRGDVTSMDEVRRAVAGCDRVIHLAGIVQISGNDKLIMDVNLGGTQNIVAACREAGAKLVYVSSVHVFEPKPDGTIDETCALAVADAMDTYGRSKALATRCVLEAAASGLDAAVALPTAIIGPYCYQRSLTEQAVEVLTHARGLYVWLDGAYDFVDVRDCAAGLIDIMERGERGGMYILAGERITVRDLIAAVGRCNGRKLRLFHLPLPLAKLGCRVLPALAKLTGKKPLIDSDALEVLITPVNIVADRAVNEIGYKHRPVLETVEDTVKWVKQKYGRKSKTKKVL